MITLHVHWVFVVWATISLIGIGPVTRQALKQGKLTAADQLSISLLMIMFFPVLLGVQLLWATYKLLIRGELMGE